MHKSLCWGQTSVIDKKNFRAKPVNQTFLSNFNLKFVTSKQFKIEQIFAKVKIILYHSNWFFVYTVKIISAKCVLTSMCANIISLSWGVRTFRKGLLKCYNNKEWKNIFSNF